MSRFSLFCVCVFLQQSGRSWANPALRRGSTLPFPQHPHPCDQKANHSPIQMRQFNSRAKKERSSSSNNGDGDYDNNHIIPQNGQKFQRNSVRSGKNPLS